MVSSPQIPVKNCRWWWGNDTKQPSNISRTYVQVSRFYFSSPAHLVIIRLACGFPTTRDLCVSVRNPFGSVNLSSMCRKYSSPLHLLTSALAKMLISDVSTVGVNVRDLGTKNSCRTSGILTNFWRLCSNNTPNWILAAEMFCRFSINKLEESAVVFFRSDRAQTISERDGVKREISSRVVIIRISHFTFGPYRN